MKAGDRIAIVRTLPVVPREWNRVFELVGAPVEFRCAAKLRDYLFEAPIKAGNRAGFERKFSPVAMVIPPDQPVIDEVQLEIDTGSGIEHNARREACGAHIERGV